MRSSVDVIRFALIASAAGLMVSGLRGWHADLTSYPWDGSQDWVGARAFISGTDPFSPIALRREGWDSLGHPPTTSFWLLPFAYLSLQGMKIPFDLGVALVVFASLLVTLREFRVPLWPYWGISSFLAVCNTSWMHYHLQLAQVSGLIAGCYVASWYFARRGKDFRAGLFLGLAFTLKFYPGLLGLAFLLARRWRVLLGGLAAYAPIFSLMTWRFGVSAWPEYLGSEGTMVSMWTGHPHNASLYGVIVRMWSGKSYVNVTPTSDALHVACVAAIALMVISLFITRQTFRGCQFDLGYAFLVVVSVFCNPFAFEHYFVLLIHPLITVIWIICCHYLEGHSGVCSKVAAILTGCVVLILAHSHWSMDSALSTGHLGLFYAFQVMNWIHLPILLTIVALLITEGRRPSRPSSERRLSDIGACADDTFWAHGPQN
jgi:hypothetical protein